MRIISAIAPGNPQLKLSVCVRKKTSFTSTKVPVATVNVDLDEIQSGPGEPEWFDLVPEGDEPAGGRLLLHLSFSRDVGQLEDGGGETLQVDDDIVMADDTIGDRFDEV